jgi:hypothetical protein
LSIVLAGGTGTACAEPDPFFPMLLTVLTVLTVFSTVACILMILFPARPSRLNAMSMPSARRKVWARRLCGTLLPGGTTQPRR